MTRKLLQPLAEEFILINHRYAGRKILLQCVGKSDKDRIVGLVLTGCCYLGRVDRGDW